MGLMARAVPDFLLCVTCDEALAECVEDDPTRWRARPALLEPAFDSDDVRLSSLICSTSPRHLILTSTFPPAGVNLRLLLTRLIMTCKIRCWSPQRHMSFNRPTPAGPRAGSLLSRLLRSGLGLTSTPSFPTKFTLKLMRFSFTCLSKMERT